MYMNQWNKTENPEIKHPFLVNWFSLEAPKTHARKEQSLQHIDYGRTIYSTIQD